ncbi:hypothetical protein GUJ93_ZPchr0002g22947 [Zizania palustris]|uniref:Uncharacterized protein n=1 Tax=Zizania palustris TaxID=103762 RepID=A0A8J5VV12_ZIZPA|nr:hypothetical protein GUJ93_ZPchr0002g22947 [Zizania palustris]
MEKKRVAIVGAGASGLAACKHALERGFRPVVFEADEAAVAAAGAEGLAVPLSRTKITVPYSGRVPIGECWVRTIASTRLQTPRPYFHVSRSVLARTTIRALRDRARYPGMAVVLLLKVVTGFGERVQTPRPYFEFFDYPWPPGVTDLYPDHDQVTEYLRSYAKRFGVLVRVCFGCRVSALEYAGTDEGELMAWEHWAGNGQAFGDGRLVGLEDHRPEAALQRVLARGQPAGSGADDGHPLLLHSKSEWREDRVRSIIDGFFGSAMRQVQVRSSPYHRRHQSRFLQVLITLDRSHMEDPHGGGIIEVRLPPSNLTKTEVPSCGQLFLELITDSRCITL